MIEFETKEAHAEPNKHIDSVVKVRADDNTISADPIEPDEKLYTCNTEKVACLVVVARPTAHDVKHIKSRPWVDMGIMMPDQRAHRYVHSVTGIKDVCARHHLSGDHEKT